MTESLIEPKSLTRQKVIYDFEPNQQYESIKKEIINRYKKQKVNVKKIEIQHRHGLPSPPVEEKKILEEVPVEKVIDSKEIQEKIELLKAEKHRLFQFLKKMMAEEERKKKEKTSTKKKSRWSPIDSIHDKQPYHHSQPRYGVYPRPL